MGAANGLALGEEDFLELGLRFDGQRDGGAFLKPPGCAHHALDLGEIVQIVGGDVDGAGGRQAPVERGDKRGLKEAPGMVAAFRPGVGKEDVVGGDGLGGDQFFDEVAGLDLEEADIGAGVGVALAGHLVEADQLALDAEKVVLGALAGGPEEEAAFAAADVDFQGAGRAGEKRGPRERVQPVGGLVKRGGGGVRRIGFRGSGTQRRLSGS